MDIDKLIEASKQLSKRLDGLSAKRAFHMAQIAAIDLEIEALAAALAPASAAKAKVKLKRARRIEAAKDEPVKPMEEPSMPPYRNHGGTDFP